MPCLYADDCLRAMIMLLFVRKSATPHVRDG
eukprot:SAG31_NODE_36422_length_313_cov_1.158879_2_plen_30_part_01